MWQSTSALYFGFSVLLMCLWFIVHCIRSITITITITITIAYDHHNILHHCEYTFEAKLDIRAV